MWNVIMGLTLDSLLGVMETDFLNFRDEEHFGTGLYQNDLLDDSQGSILDIVGDGYSRHDSERYIDNSVIWDQDIERELNGDVAVIPMSGQINTFPKLSNSPPTKDFQKFFSDWQHLAIETAPTEDLTSDLLPTPLLDCFNPAQITPILPLVPTDPSFPPLVDFPSDTVDDTTKTIVSTFDFSHTTIPSTSKTPATFELDSTETFTATSIPPSPPIVPPVRKAGGGKNLELLKKVVKEENEFIKAEQIGPDDLENATDNFDITSYINGDYDLMLKASEVKQEPRVYRKLVGCYEKQLDSDDDTSAEELATPFRKMGGGSYEKHMPEEPPKVELSPVKPELKPIKVEPPAVALNNNNTNSKRIHIEKEDSEEDCVDVETVENEQIPVLQARDLTSLLEQFEASEAVNPKKSKLIIKPDKTTSDSSTTPPTIPKKLDKPKKPKPAKLLKTTDIPLELIRKFKAAAPAKKQISVIPAIPTTTSTKKKLTSTTTTTRIQKIQKFNFPSAAAAAGPPADHQPHQLDHDYCTPLRNNDTPKKPTVDAYYHAVKPKKPQILAAETTAKRIDDTALRIGKQIKNAINNENAKILRLKHQDLLLNKPPNGKQMISLLKTNRNTTPGLGQKNNLINNINNHQQPPPADKITKIINDPDEEAKHNSKKRKLNLAEYKKLRGDLIKTSCDTSRATSPQNSRQNSPAPEKAVVEEKYQELISKMASDILKINAKSKQQPPSVEPPTLEVFPPPPAPPEQPPQVKIEPAEDAPKPLPTETYEMKTLVSIGVNTDEVLITPSPKFSFKFAKKIELLPKSNIFHDAAAATPKLADKLEIIPSILQSACAKINSNSLITNITATLLQKKQEGKVEDHLPKMTLAAVALPVAKVPEPVEHGEDKTVIILDKNCAKPKMESVGIQTDRVIVEEVPAKVAAALPVVVKPPVKVCRQYRTRRDSSASSAASGSSVKCKTTQAKHRKTTGTHRKSHRTSSSNSLNSSLGSRWSRSRSRSRSTTSQSDDYSDSSYSSNSSRSESRSVSPTRRWHTTTTRNARSSLLHSSRYSRSRRRSRSNSYHRRSVAAYQHRSRSPFGRRRDSAERERMREVEERRVIYVGKISLGTTKADLRRRFQSFGPITRVSVHFRDQGDNYGFVTFEYKVDAYEAVEHGNDDPTLPQYDISFGGRREFCKSRYSDLDNIEAEEMTPNPLFRREDESFDMLLQEFQAELRKRKV